VTRQRFLAVLLTDIVGSTKRAAELRDEAWQEVRRRRDRPDNAQRRVVLGLALAYLGKKDDAVREGARGAALSPLGAGTFAGSYVQHQLVRIYILVGEPEKALDRLEPLLEVPYHLSPAWLRIDPNFDPLRSNPRFQHLVAGA
jgi:hypothetical protein